MKLNLKQHVLTVTAEPGDPRITDESHLWYRLKLALNAQGHALIKKCPGKDGHLTSAPYYLRSRKILVAPGGIECIFDENHQVKNLRDTYRDRGEITLRVFRANPSTT